jgi:predicted RNase H-like HicB family nuclease
VLPELITEGDTPDEVMPQVRDALAAVLELYEDQGNPLPANLQQDPQMAPIWFESLVDAS